MTIRTLIEISSETTGDHNSQLRDALDRLGFEPKTSAEHARFMALLFEELRERGLDPQKLVEEREARRPVRGTVKAKPEGDGE